VPGSIGITVENGGNVVSSEQSLAIPLSRRPEIADYSEILDRIEKGDRSALPRLRQILDDVPDIVEELGDLTKIARSAIRNRLGADGLLLGEVLERKETALAAEIAGPNPTILERLLSDQIVLCWQHLRYLQIKYGQTKEHTFREGEYFERCIDKAQKRYLSAIKTLAQIRKLGLPALQVNIAAEGGKQVNVA